MRIVIDMQGAQTGSRFRGIGRYTISLAQAIVRNRGEHDVILLVNGMLSSSIPSIRENFKNLLPRQKIQVWNAASPVGSENPQNTNRRLIAEVVQQDFIKNLHPDVFLVMSFFEGLNEDGVTSIPEAQQAAYPCPVAVIFYDAIPLIEKEKYLDPHPFLKKAYEHKIEQIKNADLLLAISESSKKEATHYLGFPSEKVVNIRAAVEPIFTTKNHPTEKIKEFKDIFDIRDQFILYSGATDQRKNHKGLISAYSILPNTIKKKYQLVLAGGLPAEHLADFEKHIKKCGLTKNQVIFTGRISDDFLVLAYSSCALYVFPSWHEGFGLPVLEAMSCGAAVIGANTTSIPEVIGREDALFDPHSPSSIAEKIAEILENPERLATLRAHSLAQAKKFSWDISAKSALQALEKISTSTHGKKKSPQGLIDRLLPLIQDTPENDLKRLAQAISCNIPNTKPQLLIDVSELVQRDSRTGIQRVVRSILQQWFQNPPSTFDLHLVYADKRYIGYRYAKKFTRLLLDSKSDSEISVLTADEDHPIDFSNGDIFIALDLQPEVQTFQALFYKSMQNYGVDVRFVIYDLLPVTLPDCFPPSADLNHAKWLEVASEADGVICISQSVAQSFQRWAKQKYPTKTYHRSIDWFHLGADLGNSMPTTGLPSDAETVLQRIRSAASFLMVGTLEPRKGHTQVLEAFERLWSQGAPCQLVLVGRAGWRVEALLERLRQHPRRQTQLFWLEGISDEYLEKIYAASTCLIAASYDEGFGLPLIEAAQHKLPIMARDIAVFREVAGEHAYYFDGLAPQDLASAIERWLALHASGQHPRSDAMPWLTWAQSAQQLLQRILPASAQPGSQPLHNTSQIGL